MPENDETIALLREIRDLQKAHFEQYRLFTSTAMEQQKKGAAALDDAQVEGQRFRERQLLIQEQTLRDMARGRVMIVVSAVLQGFMIAAIAFLAVFVALWRW